MTKYKMMMICVAVPALILISSIVIGKQTLLLTSSQVSAVPKQPFESEDEQLLVSKPDLKSKLPIKANSETVHEHVDPTDIQIDTNDEESAITSTPLLAVYDESGEQEWEQEQDLSTITEKSVKASGNQTNFGVEEDIDERLSCVIHVGPHKTGSSSLQSFLLLNTDVGNALLNDNYRIPFFQYGAMYTSKQRAKNHGSLAYCLRSLEGNQLDHRCSTYSIRDNNLKYFQSFVDNAARAASNILLTAEQFDFDDLNIAGVVSPLVPYYNIHIVVYYQRFYDWIHSLYNQWTKSGLIEKTFVEWLTPDIIELWQHRYSVAVYERYKNHDGIYNVSVVNMHEDPANFNTNIRFACDHLDHAHSTCQVAKSTKVNQSNGSVDVNWMLFRSYMSTNRKIHYPASIWEQLKQKFNDMTITDIPKVCLPPELRDELLRVSLEAETILTPKHWYDSNEGLEDLKSDFDEKIARQLCSIDTKAIWSSDEWQRNMAEFK